MHNLHGPNHLFDTRYGHVLQCTCCDRIQITFREHTLLVDEDELEVLTDTVKYAWRQVRDAPDQDQWNLQAGTDAGPIAITLTEPSLRKLHDLLQGAWAMYVLQARVRAAAPETAVSSRTVVRDYVPASRPRRGNDNRLF